MYTASYRSLAWTALVVLTLSLGTLPAVAGHDDDEWGDHPGRGHSKHASKHAYNHHSHGPSCGHDYYRPSVRYAAPRYVPPPRFVVPGAIAYSSLRVYAPYFQGEVYFAPHHHNHSLYYFPAASPYGETYRPHYYCGASHFEPYAVYDRPRVSLNFNF